MNAAATGTEPEYAGVVRTFRETPVAVRLVLLGVFINQFGAFLQAFVVLYLVARGFSTQQAGIALGAYSVGTIAGVLLGGGLTARLGPRWTIVCSVASAALLTLSVTVLGSLPAIVVAVELAGAMTQASRPAVSALLFGMVPQARQVMVFAMYRTALQTGAVAGPLVAAALSTVSWNLVFWVDAATALAYCGIAAFMLPRDAPSEPAGPASPAQTTPKAGYSAVLRDRRYLAYLALMLANGLVHVQFIAVLPLMLLAAGYPTWAYGTAVAVSAALVITSELAVTKSTQRWPIWIAVMLGWLLLVVGRSAFGLPGGLAVILIATAIGVAGQIIGGPSAFAYPAKVAPAGAVGRYVGSAHAAFALGYAIGPIVGIALWSALGNSFWALCLLLGLVMIPPGVWAMRQVDRAQPAAGAPSRVESTS
jgi:MFS family permease